MVSEWLGLITVAGVVVSLVLNVVSLRDRDKKQTEEYVEMRSDVKHIREKVDTLEEKMNDIPERLTAVERDLKSAHRRIDKLEQKN